MLNLKQIINTIFLTVLCVLGVCTLQSCSDNHNNSQNWPFTRNRDGTVTDSNGVTCMADDGNHAECYPDLFQSSCKNGKAVVCGNSFTHYEVFEFECDCKMVDGKATCGECTPGEVDRTSESAPRMCNPAGLWENVGYKLNHPEELTACNAATYKPKCINNMGFECNSLNGTLSVYDCNQTNYYGRTGTCVETTDKLQETEFDQYILQCIKECPRAYCAECKPGEEAEKVCISFYSLTTAPVKCSEHGFWVDKETGDIPQTERCDNGCTEGKCLGDPVGCEPNETADHVCYTEDSFVIDSVTCMVDGKRWADLSEPIRIEYCANGCIDNVCHK